MSEQHIDQRFSVNFDYPVVFTRDVFAPDSPILVDALDRADRGRKHRCLVYVDSEVNRLTPDLQKQITDYFAVHSDHIELAKDPCIMPGGEAAKNDYRLTMEIVDTIMEYKLCRQSFVIAIGGGAVLDAVGFAASLVHRGLRTVRLPTTVLAQNDAGVGVKNGMNLHGGKNTVGTFHPPFAVINDFTFLKTLPDREWIAGISEAYKVALIKDADFFEFLCSNANALRARNDAAMEHLIVRCAELHLEHISTNGDPFELGRARPLDFGHWAAHKLESMSNYRIGHGQAVATGIAIDSFYAMRKGWIRETDFDAIHHGLRESGFELWCDELNRRLGDSRLEILRGLDDFKEHLGGELCVTFPDGVGKKKEVHEVEEGVVENAVAFLREHSTHNAEQSTRK
ncbi:MAG: 3-dehydroquinate synthase [Verrucomicrobia bacterium]|nr:3-dehydroquinate synthase [Verrucomicrobiota bacterium]